MRNKTLAAILILLSFSASAQMADRGNLVYESTCPDAYRIEVYLDNGVDTWGLMVKNHQHIAYPAARFKTLAITVFDNKGMAKRIPYPSQCAYVTQPHDFRVNEDSDCATYHIMCD